MCEFRTREFADEPCGRAPYQPGGSASAEISSSGYMCLSGPDEVPNVVAQRTADGKRILLLTVHSIGLPNGMVLVEASELFRFGSAYGAHFGPEAHERQDAIWKLVLMPMLMREANEKHCLDIVCEYLQIWCNHCRTRIDVDVLWNSRQDKATRFDSFPCRACAY